MLELDIQRFANPKLVIDAELNTRNFERGLDEIKNDTNRAGSTIKNIVAGLGITKLISVAMGQIRNSIDGAISRIDTLNNFPKVMESLGISAEDSEKAIKKMSDKLAGLPTTLDQGASAVKRFVSYNGDVKKSTDMFLAVNNAILAGGASAELQASAMEQLTQAYTKGKPEAQDWKTLMQAMPAQLKQIATTMGYTSTAIGGDFYEALQKGEISMDDFMNTAIQLNKKGGDGFKSFTEQAKTGTEGIGTSIEVAKTQIVKGVADIITSINKGLQDANLPNISELITILGKKAKQALDFIAKAIPPVIKLFKQLEPVISDVAIAIGTMYVAFKTLTIISTITKTIQAFKLGIVALQTTATLAGGSLSTLRAGLMMLNATFLASPIFWIIGAIVALIAVIVLLYKKCDWFRKMVDDMFGTIKDGVSNAIKRIKDILSELWEKIKAPLQKLMPSLKKLWESLKPIVSILLKIIGAGILIFIEAVVKAIELLAKVLEFIIPIVTEVITTLVNFVTKIVEFFTKTIPSAFENFKKNVTELFTKIVDFFKNFPENISYLIGYVLASIAMFLMNLGQKFIEFITNDVPNFINGIIDWFKQLPNKIWEWLQQLPGKISQAITNMKNTASSKLSEFVNLFVSTVRKIPNKMNDIGKDIINGIITGLNSKIKDLKKKMNEIGESIKKGVKDALKIKSPSRVMRDEVGKMAALGIEVGFEDEIKNVYRSMQHAIDMEQSKLQASVETGKVFNTLQNSTPVNINLNAGIDLDGQRVGRLITPEVSRTIKSGGGTW